MSVCLVCLDPVQPAGDYHPDCAFPLFRSTSGAILDIARGEMLAIAVQTSGRSLGGVQKKLAVKLSRAHDKPLLFLTHEGTEFIVKPASEAFPSLPENEHVTTRLAVLAGIASAPSGLVRLKDGSLAFLIRRFDRIDRLNGGNTKLPVEDFCQLMELPPSELYNGSAERCARIVRQHCVADLPALFRRLLFAYWVGDGDLHLKNLSLLGDGKGTFRLSPAYDLVASEAYFVREPEMAMMIDGRNKRIGKRAWFDFGERCGLVAESVRREGVEFIRALSRGRELIRRSFVDADTQRAIIAQIERRSAEIATW